MVNDWKELSRLGMSCVREYRIARRKAYKDAKYANLATSDFSPEGLNRRKNAVARSRDGMGCPPKAF
jgi:hypothetical protein